MKKRRFKITSVMCDSVNYLTLSDNEVYLCDKDENPTALSAITRNAVELRHALEDACDHAFDGSASGRSMITVDMAIKAINKHCNGYISSVEELS